MWEKSSTEKPYISIETLQPRWRNMMMMMMMVSLVYTCELHLYYRRRKEALKDVCLRASRVHDHTYLLLLGRAYLHFIIRVLQLLQRRGGGKLLL